MGGTTSKEVLAVSEIQQGIQHIENRLTGIETALAAPAAVTTPSSIPAPIVVQQPATTVPTVTRGWAFRPSSTELALYCGTTPLFGFNSDGGGAMFYAKQPQGNIMAYGIMCGRQPTAVWNAYGGQLNMAASGCTKVPGTSTPAGGTPWVLPVISPEPNVASTLNGWTFRSNSNVLCVVSPRGSVVAMWDARSSNPVFSLPQPGSKWASVYGLQLGASSPASKAPDIINASTGLGYCIQAAQFVGGPPKATPPAPSPTSLTDVTSLIVASLSGGWNFTGTSTSLTLSHGTKVVVTWNAGDPGFVCTGWGACNALITTRDSGSPSVWMASVPGVGIDVVAPGFTDTSS